MNRQKMRVVNTKTAVRCVIYPIDALKEREPDQLMSEVLEAKPVKRRLPGTALLIKLDKQRKKEKQKKAEERKNATIDSGAVDAAMARIMADMKC